MPVSCFEKLWPNRCRYIDKWQGSNYAQFSLVYACMHSLLQDLRFSLRLMRKRPGASFLVLTALALGIGVNAAVFSAVNASLIRPLPVDQPDRIVFFFAKTKEQGYIYYSYPEFLDLKARSRSFQNMSAARGFSFNMTGNGLPEHLSGVGASASYFKILGVTPALGRDFTDDDDRPGAPRVAIINYGLWQRRFGGDHAILGKTLILDGQLHTIIGVLPPSHFYYLQNIDVWVDNVPFLDPSMASREMRYFGILARLAPGVTAKQAQSEMNVLAQQLADQYPKSNQDIATTVATLVDMVPPLRDRHWLWLWSSASALVLVLAWVNVATISIAAAVERRKELSVRFALGASRFVLLRQLFVQSCIFTGLGSLVGLVVAKLGLTLVLQRFPWALARFRETTVDSTVVWFTLCTALVTTLLSSLIPGMYTAKLNINSELKGELAWTPWSRFRSVGQGVLIFFEVWLAASLVLVSGLLIKSFYEITKTDLGFEPQGLMCFSIALPDARYDEKARSAFYRRALEKLSAIPGVTSVSGSDVVPMTPSGHSINLQVDAQSPRASARPFIDNPQILPGFFAIMKTQVVQGREFTQADRLESSPVTAIDEATAAQMWPGQNALGKRLRVADVTDDQAPWREIVGVVRQIRYRGPEANVNRLQIYTPAYQVPPVTMFFVLNSKISLVSLKPPVEKAIHELDAELALDNFKPLDYYLDLYEGRRKLSLLLLSGFAAVGISLGMVGIYGVVANAVLRRRRELAIRMALGASKGNCITLVTRLGLAATLAGIVIGSVTIAVSAKALAGFFFNVKPLDQQIYTISAIVIVILALIASLVPATALLRLSPQDVLRE